MACRKRGNPFESGKSWTFYYYMPDGRLRHKGGYESHALAKMEKKTLTALVDSGSNIPGERLSISDFLVD